jgi:hypothetical protein
MSTQETPKKNCFVICPIGSDGGETRRRSDKLLKYVIRPILELEGFVVERADQLSQPGIITNQIVRKILDCDILVADLSEGNPNVFYELAIRHGTNKPFIHMIDAKEKIPFDNSQVRTISVDLNDLDSVDKAKTELIAQVRNAVDNPDAVESPISFSLDLEKLNSSKNSDEQVLAAIFREVQDLSAEVRNLKRHSRGIPLARIRITSAENLVDALEANNYLDLANLIRGVDVDIENIDGNIIHYTSLLSTESDRDFEADMKDALKAITGRTWKLIYGNPG